MLIFPVAKIRTVFRRREAEGAIIAGGADVLYEEFRRDLASGLIEIQEETEEVGQEFADVLEQCYSAIPIVFLRTNDGLHLASAKAAAQIDFVTADLRQKWRRYTLG